MPRHKSRFRLRFHRTALKEFRAIDIAHQRAFRNKLEKLLDGRERPTPKNALHGFPPGFYKIKLRQAGLRLVYHYDGKALVILVVAVARRERNLVYEAARARARGME